MKLIAQGAESKLFVKGDKLIKRRIRKGYRIKEIDLMLRKHRTRVEARMLKRCAKIINVPAVRSVSEFEIVMDYIDAPVLRDIMPSASKELLAKVGEMVGKLHKHNYIHGDLTTSNMLVKEGEIYVIDFGLSEVRDSTEAKAVDLHLLKQALESKHYKEFRHTWEIISKSYARTYEKGKEVLKRLEIVEKRGRYKNRS